MRGSDAQAVDIDSLQICGSFGDMSTVLQDTLGGPDPHSRMVTRRDKGDYSRVLLYSYYTIITGLGVFLKDTMLQAHLACLAALSPRKLVLNAQ